MNWSEFLPSLLSGATGALIVVLLELASTVRLRKRQAELERDLDELRRSSDPRAIEAAVYALREGSSVILRRLCSTTVSLNRNLIAPA